VFGLVGSPPAGFVDVTGWLLLHVVLQFIDGLGQGLADDLLLIDRTARRESNPKTVDQQISHLAFAQPVAANQQSHL
jgi:hypothetical protein